MKDKIIFATTNPRKLEDLKELIKNKNLSFDVITMKDIGWDRGEIEEDGSTIEENSMIKAKATQEFCKEKNISLPIIADDAGLFVRALDGEPGVKTARYADEELKLNPELPKYECVNKLLRKLKNTDDRYAEYQCAITCILPSGKILTQKGKTAGKIAEEMDTNIKKPYFYTVFIPEGKTNTMSQLSYKEIQDTYRLKALAQIFMRIQRELEER